MYPNGFSADDLVSDAVYTVSYTHLMFMDGGVVVEEGPAKQRIEHPQEERTKQFLAHYSE